MQKFDRHRRLRSSAAMRDLVRESHIQKDDLIMPVFIEAGLKGKTEISSMPGVYHFGLDTIMTEIKSIVDLGIKAIILFGLPDHKDEVGTGAWEHDGIVQEATRLIKKSYPDLIVIADTCLCEYTSTGHCGIVKDGVVLNDESLEYITKTAVSQVEAGADIIAPSNAMDGYVAAIREGLDNAGYKNTPIMSYAVKYASSFYGPFREAADSAPAFGDRKTYQMDPANRLDALREVESDEKEGADFVMVKPSMAFLDVMREVRDHTILPLVAYNVSGEYAMVKAAAANGWIDEDKIVNEILVGMKRAGADLIITYFAKDVAAKL
ncbi:porphobilinogen synthase [Furfurilactobacillus rossiae]|uniref:Delta-aminolevulinic acid dehydratase n=1 Tax=Furfurilactobacillus rossiae DSM 15814 TaxID=1114972 RepID=A0A0R1RHE7_9LACO|nr:porphobilinogen synthase [Furfurilactobacillus rossiae]KRL56150.1 delta-aminolevulinic acid dehydratase [Furfurilactobacillus rossiae DSM 15814]MCF6165840.1 porphobilinogen synthase [Furfurilactobacillus rossiae]QFR66174.1 porphobilinogen synthase [Furfurilactobacillus rossiae]QLE61607.1 Porphobilinogen synthase [Furfurilactobacillus rossiae]QLE64404.1 Porphobilinogen synthase [Furfurilactobacillus rossiae]